MGLPSFSIRRPVLTVMLFLAVLILGVISLMRLQVELYQGRNQGIISIIVRARGGLPPLEVERHITRPIEEAVSTVSHLKNMYSNSREAESRVTFLFEPGTDMNFAALEVREKFARVKPLLPREIEKPVIANYSDEDSAIFVFALTSETLPPEEVRDMVETELKPTLARVSGVASVEVYGGRERKILIEVDRDKMVGYNIPIGKIMDILGQSNVNLLAGTVDTGKIEFAIRSMGAFVNVEEIGEIGIQATRQGSIIPLNEIATVKDSYLEPGDYARLNLEQNVTVYIKKTSFSQTLPVVKTLRIVLDEFEKAYKDSMDIVVVTDNAETISKAIGDVKNALFVGMWLAVGLIYLFLRQLVLAFIVFVSIPCSVIATFVFMNSLGISLNVMTLSGLALAIGILVDSTVVILENVFSKKEKGLSDSKAIREGSEEVWLPLLASLLTTLIVFLPVVFIDKSIQIQYVGFVFTVCASLIASFFVAQMAVPVMLMEWAHGSLKVRKRRGAQFFRKLVETVWVKIKGFNKRERWFLIGGAALFVAVMTWQGLFQENKIWRKCFIFFSLGSTVGLFALMLVKGVYRRLAEWNLQLRYMVLLVFGVFLFVSVRGCASMPMDYPKTLEENEFSIVIFPLAGARLEANDDAVKKIEEILSKIPDVDMISSTIRKDRVRIFVRLKPRKDRQYSKEEIMNLLDEKGNEAIKEIHDDYSLIIDEGVSSSEEKKLIVNIFGHENDVLEKLAREFAGRMARVPGMTNIVMTDLRKRPEYSLTVDKGRAAVYGLSVKNIADSVHAQVRGMRPTKFHELEKGEEIETITRLQAIYRQKIEDIEMIPLMTKSGVQIRLGEIANFYASTGPQTIDRRNKYRYVFVKGDTKKPLEEVAEGVKGALRGVKLPDDYFWRFDGAYVKLMKGKSDLVIAFILTLFLVYMVMACLFQDYVEPLLIMLTIPMAIIGIWMGLKMTDKPLSEQVFIGMILLAGYVVNAAIILVDHINNLLAKDMPLKEALVEAGQDRLRPILMTALSTTFGFLPLAVGWGQSSDLWSPLAITVIGGLLSATLLTLFILPDFIWIAKVDILKIKDFFPGLLAFRFGNKNLQQMSH